MRRSGKQHLAIITNNRDSKYAGCPPPSSLLPPPSALTTTPQEEEKEGEELIQNRTGGRRET